MLFTRRLPINNASQFQEDFFVSESNEDENWKKRFQCLQMLTQ